MAPRPTGTALRAAGLIEGGARGIELLEESVDTLARSPSALEHARALVDLGAALRRHGKRQAARDPLRRGLEMARRFGARALERRALEELQVAGGKPRRTQLDGVDALTPGERRVALMAAGGMSNVEIAQALFVTVPAVKWHLRHAYQKLDITSRRELDRALGTDGQDRHTG
jgi:DNA-binding CsgD family transcriptional regulator